MPVQERAKTLVVQLRYSPGASGLGGFYCAFRKHPKPTRTRVYKALVRCVLYVWHWSLDWGVGKRSEAQVLCVLAALFHLHMENFWKSTDVAISPYVLIF